MCKSTKSEDDARSTAVSTAVADRDEVVISSKVAFRPKRHQGQYWRIAGKLYDFTPMLDTHPGGRDMLLLARDRFEDCTFAFEAYHPNYERVRGALQKYEVAVEDLPEEDVDSAEERVKRGFPTEFIPDTSVYSVLRRKVADYLRKNGGSGPTKECLRLWWWCVAGFVASFSCMVATGSVVAAVVTGIFGALIGGFGHNWVHQPKYRNYAYSLDVVGFSSEAWLRDHNLQHHMYTNGPLDNHLTGSEPFLMTDPTKERPFWQGTIFRVLQPFLLSFGVYANYFEHTNAMIKGFERFSVGKLFLPMEIVLLVYCWGLSWGLLLTYAYTATIGVWYFTLALINHNAETNFLGKTSTVKVQDWGHGQMISSTDLGHAGGETIYSSARFLWLNYHTVHHMFPSTDMSKHPGIQKVVMETLKEEFPEIAKHYRVDKNFWKIYCEMMTSFTSARHLGRELMEHAG
jgi:fatty acid desaturase/cytochrome b involved in lipid metabolism